jgi:hypothetical protein
MIQSGIIVFKDVHSFHDKTKSRTIYPMGENAPGMRGTRAHVYKICTDSEQSSRSSPDELILEFEKLQDNVPPMSGELAVCRRKGIKKERS